MTTLFLCKLFILLLLNIYYSFTFIIRMMSKKLNGLAQRNQVDVPIGRYIDVKTDLSFKYAFGVDSQKRFLISFLNSIFKGRKVIKDISYDNPSRKGMHKKNRKTVFDIYCTCSNGEKIVVEIQQSSRKFFKDRIFYYAAKLIHEQGDSVDPDWNYYLPEIYVIALMNFCFEDSHPDCYFHDVQLVDVNTNTTFYKKLNYIFVELPKFKKTETELKTGMDKWLYSIKNMENLPQIPLPLNKHKIFRDFYRVTETANLTPKDMTAYEYELKRKRDNFSADEYARSEAQRLGQKLGEELGAARERLKAEKEKRNAALTLKKNNVPINLIANATGLTVEEIEALV